MQSNLQSSTSDDSNQSLFANGEDPLSSPSVLVIPHARWVVSNLDSSDHTFIASAVLTPVALDHYTGSSRKYSVAY